MVKSYLKYEQSQCFGTVVSVSSNISWAPNDDATAAAQRSTGAGRAYVGANEQVLCWDIKKGELVSIWQDKDCTAQVTVICQSNSDPDIFAVGYGDGSIRLWDSRISTVIINFNGHRSAVSSLAFDHQGVRLASGSRDTDIIIWDLVSETGLFKLRGHKNQITGLHFLQIPIQDLQENGDSELDGSSTNNAINGSAGEDFLLSTSKEALIKLWDMNSQHCFETHVTQSNGECWALGVSPDNSGCVTAGNDGELKVWTLNTSILRNLSSNLHHVSDSLALHERGTIRRASGDRCTGVAFHPKSDFIAVYGSEKAVELFRIRSLQEVQRSLARKRRRKREKIAASKSKDGDEKDEDIAMEDGSNDLDDPSLAPVTEFFIPHVIVRPGGKVRSADWIPGSSSKNLRLLISTTNNQIELYDISQAVELSRSAREEVPEYARTSSVELPGHRTDIRAMSLSSDDRMLATASNGSLKIWNIRTQACLRTLDCGYSLTCSFLPGDKIVLVGNQKGEIELFDIASSALIDTIQAHDGPIWTLKVHPDGRSVATGSADKTVKFWNFEVHQEEIPGTKRTIPKLQLVHKRTLKLKDDILNICFSPDSRLIAVSTLDNTVKVFFLDTLKPFLDLYGHKLPVLNMSISADSKLIATSSADKNVRLWGLDFGDCHKAFFAHDESILQVSFVAEPESKEDAHMFFTASKDHNIKTWDGDKFVQIQRLSGHHGEIWAMAVSRTGQFVVTASHDKSIRVWEQTDEPLFLEEERERELEEMYDRNLASTLERDQEDEYAAAEGAGENTEVVSASKQTSTTLTASEKIAEALTICTEDLDVVREADEQAAANPGVRHAPPQRHPLLSVRNVSAEEHLLSVFEAIPAAALQDALLLLSFSSLPSLFIFMSIWLQREMNVPLTCRILFFLLKTHHKQIVASRELRVQLEDMKARLRDCLGRWKDMLGFNMVATKILAERIGQGRVRSIEDEEMLANSAFANGKKRGFVNVA